MNPASHPIVFYDGVCGLCDGFVQFVLQHDRNALFQFAPLQSQFARDTLLLRGFDPSDLQTVHVLVGERVLRRANAVLYVLGRIGMPWAAFSALQVLPEPLLDAGYRMVARARYRLLGQYDACPVPDPRWRDRFVEGE